MITMCVRWFLVVINCGYQYDFLRNSLAIFGLVLPPFSFCSANMTFSLILNLNLNFGLIRKFAIRIIGLI